VRDEYAPLKAVLDAGSNIIKGGRSGNGIVSNAGYLRNKR